MDATRVIGTAALLLAVWGGAPGCTGGSPLRDGGQARTPYERYQALRGQSRPKTVTDSFGREQPALRARLAPLDQP